MGKSLHGLSQAIHQDHLDPPTKFLLHSAIVQSDDGDQIWELRLYANIGGRVEAWVSRIEVHLLPAADSVIQETIHAGMLQVDLQGEKTLRQAANLELQLLRDGDDPICIQLEPSNGAEVDGAVLLEATFTLLARKPTGGQPDKAEFRNLRNQVLKKDEEISKLQTQLVTLRATADSSRSNEIKKKLAASPKKPVGASTLQPNAKRRKAVEDEFAGSDSD